MRFAFIGLLLLDVAICVAQSSYGPEQYYRVGHAYEYGENGYSRDYSKAADLLRKASGLDYAPARYELGLLYKEGLGVEKDLGTAASLWEMAAKQSNEQAKAELNRLCAFGLGVASEYDGVRLVCKRSVSEQLVEGPASRYETPAVQTAVQTKKRFFTDKSVNAQQHPVAGQAAPSGSHGKQAYCVATAGARDGQLNSGKAYYSYLYPVGPKFDNESASIEFSTFLKEHYGESLLNGYNCWMETPYVSRRAHTNESEAVPRGEHMNEYAARGWQIVEMEWKPSKGTSGY
jgi:TPR repeat protein